MCKNKTSTNESRTEISLASIQLVITALREAAVSDEQAKEVLNFIIAND